MAITCNICCNINQHGNTHNTILDSRTSLITYTYHVYLMKNLCAPKIQDQPTCWITSSATHSKILHPIALHISLPNALTCLWLIFTRRTRGYCLKKKSSLIFSGPSLNKHLLSHFVSYLFLLFSQGQFSELHRTVCGFVSALTSTVSFPLYTIYVSDTNRSPVPFILVIDSDVFPSMLCSLMWSNWYTWVQPFILFHWFHSWSF